MVVFHGNIGVRFFIFFDFLFPSTISMKGLNEIVILDTFYFIFCSMTISLWACPSPMPLLTTSEAVIYRLVFMPKSPRFAGIWMLGVRIWPVLERILSAATTCWRVIVLEICIPKLLPYSWIPGGRWGFESAWFWFFCIFLYQCSCFCLSYSLTVIWITPNWLLFLFCYNHPACWIRSLN